MKILKTELYFAGENIVEVYREVTPDGAKLLQYWLPIIKDEVVYTGKPRTEIPPSQDHWPDWDRLVKRARKKLADARRRNSPARHKVREFSLPKGAVAFYVGGEPAATGEITKKLIFDDK